MSNLHENYEKLTERERDFVDGVFDSNLFDDAEVEGIPLNGCDPCERAVDAFAAWVIESRKY